MIKQQMIKKVLERAPIGYMREEADGTWLVIVEKDGTLKLGGYADEFISGDRIEDLPLAELGHLLDVTEKEREELLKEVRQEIEDETR